MPKYHATLTATIEIDATNAAAAKKALEADRIGSIRVIGQCSSAQSPPSGRHDPLGWKWRVRIKDQKFSNLRNANGQSGAKK